MYLLRFARPKQCRIQDVRSQNLLNRVQGAFFVGLDSQLDGFRPDSLCNET